MPEDKDRTYLGMGPDSTMDSRTHAPSNPLWLARAKIRQRSCLPFVSWEESKLSAEDSTMVNAIMYPVHEPQGYVGFHGNRDRIRETLRKAASRMLKAGVPRKLGMSDKEFVKRISIASGNMRLSAHKGLVHPFFSWDVGGADLLAAARVEVQDVYKGVIQHLVQPEDPVVRFSQAGTGLVGVDPRHVAWRTYLEAQREASAEHDLLMDLGSFAWFLLQQDVPYTPVVLGGSFVEEADAGKRILAATRGPRGWTVGLFHPDSADGPAAVLVMS